MNHSNCIYLSLGSNLGDRKINLSIALSKIDSKLIKIITKSNIYETSPMYYLCQDFFLNMTVKCTTMLTPNNLLEFLKNIEDIMGRSKQPRNHPRIIDIDILLYNNQIINTNSLTIPHKKLCERFFVLKPLNDICPNLVLPNTSKTINELMLLVDYNSDFIKLHKDLL